MEIIDWPLVLSGSDLESALLEEHGLHGEPGVELLIVGHESAI